MNELMFDREGKARESLGATNCPGCGRFAKITRYYNYFNGSFNCCRMYLRCSRCGEQEVELV